jgi:hypothetical protein
MRKMLRSRCVAAGVLLGSIGLAAAVLPGAAASAAVAKPPVTVTCSATLGNAAQQLNSGCVGTAKSKVTTYGVAVPNGSDTGATIFWTNKDTTTITDTFGSVTNNCPTYLDVAASLKEQETATVTGGTSKLTNETAAPSDLCVYVGASDGTILVVGGSSTL